MLTPQGEQVVSSGNGQLHSLGSRVDGVAQKQSQQQNKVLATKHHSHHVSAEKLISVGAYQFALTNRPLPTAMTWLPPSLV